MSMSNQNWGGLYPSIFRHSAEPARRVPTTLRPSGAVRYRCPVSGSFVLVTEPAMLARIAERDTRLRCPDCGEMHLLAQDTPAPAIVHRAGKL
ncbi:MAG TPA: hypothetical protein VFW22_15825 [Pseudolabrys sp.]|nr:hypothetical protein [Pseudolabrys sp.]